MGWQGLVLPRRRGFASSGSLVEPGDRSGSSSWLLRVGVLLPPLSAGGAEALMLAFHVLALEKGHICPGKEFPPPVPFHLISRSEPGKEQRPMGKLGTPREGGRSPGCGSRGESGILLTKDSGAFGTSGQAYPCPGVLGMCQAVRRGPELRSTWGCLLWS